jgi:hypothetical protein
MDNLLLSTAAMTRKKAVKFFCNWGEKNARGGVTIEFW